MYKKKKQSENKKSIFPDINDFLWFLSFPVLFTFGLYVSWHVLSTQDFFYGVLYDHTELESFVDTFAPQNNFKPEFALTDRVERIRVFSEVLKAVNNDGKGLATIQFASPEGKVLASLLRTPEVEHLQLVAALVERFKYLGLACGLLAIALLLYFKYSRLPLPDFRKIMFGYTVIVLLLFALVFYLSPVKVFEGLHGLFFPAGHQWFFYYQNSLMTTLMMAPKLFAYFFIIWISLTILLWLGLSYAFIALSKNEKRV